jgi:hypothetical protein
MRIKNNLLIIKINFQRITFKRYNPSKISKIKRKNPQFPTKMSISRAKKNHHKSQTIQAFRRKNRSHKNYKLKKR